MRPFGGCTRLVTLCLCFPGIVDVLAVVSSQSLSITKKDPFPLPKISACWFLYFSQSIPVICDVGTPWVGEISRGVCPCRLVSRTIKGVIGSRRGGFG